MMLPCEVAVKFVLPSVRAMIAKRLVSNYGLKQIDAAKLLGTSQPAISFYIRRLRGSTLNLDGYPDILESIERLAGYLMKGNVDVKVFAEEFCNVCNLIRVKGLLCSCHKLIEPNINVEECNICKNT